MPMLQEYAVVSTAATACAVLAASAPLGRYAAAFTYAAGPGAPRAPEVSAGEALLSRPLATMREAVGTQGVLAFGMGFGVLAAGVHKAGRGQRRRVAARAAAEVEVAQKTKGSVIPYFENVPRSVVDKKTLDKLLSLYPREQWENPPEDSSLYMLKCYAEAYGEGKATKMGWWDFWYMRINMPEADEFYSGEEVKAQQAMDRLMCEKGTLPMFVPGPAGVLDTSAWIQWRGKEPFAGDQCQTPVTEGAFAKQWVDNIAFYREGLKPWQRGLEIGIAHGYFIIGPFVSLGPLRNTPEAATVGLLAGVALIGLVSVGGLLFGTVIKPRRFDRPGDSPAAGFQEMINWHALGGLGGAGFAHALITVFGS